MMLKSILRALIPPALWAAARPFKQKYRVYSSWAAAAAAAGNYEADVLNRFRIARGGEAVPLHDNALSWLFRIFPGEISIVDFGGSVGEVGKALKAGGKGGAYTVVENPTLVAMMNAAGAGNFKTEIPPECDVFYTSGTLQFIPEPYKALEQGFRSAAKAVVLKRNTFSEQDIFTVHTSPLFDNGTGPIPLGFSNVAIAYPSRTIRESQVVEIAKRNGFSLIMRVPETDGIAVPRDGVYGAQLAFLRDVVAGKVP